LPAHVRAAIQRLDEAGHVAYVVGGSVRDFLLKRASKDHDIATSATPDELCELFPDAVTVGKAFGVLKVPVRETGELLEIATFREDLEYKDHRHPEGVRFSGPHEDARRRDFTINALFYDFKTQRILDAANGVDDLRAKVIRAIGEPALRFREDALRLLRAVRFATTLEFTIEKETEAAIVSKAKLISHVSGERIRDELTRMLTGPHPDLALETLARLGLLKPVLTEVALVQEFRDASNDLWGITLRTLRALAKNRPGRSAELSWAAALMEIGKPVEADCGVLVRSIGHRLKFPRNEIDRVVSLVENLPKFNEVFKMREATLERFVREPWFDELLELHRAAALATDGNLAYYEFCRHRYEQTLTAEVPTKLIDGKDLIQLGFRPGPEFSEILRVVEDLALERKLVSKDQALEFVINKFVR
jgi:tRNA nucleotidyltransferase/poly(A) polymerase